MSGFNAHRNQRQAGIGIIAVIIAVLVVAVVGLIGYMVYETMRNSTSQDTSDASGQAVGGSAELRASDAPTIQTSDDLDKAAATLDRIDSETDAADSTELSGQLKDL